ncbi:MAG: hypothetical protein JW719_06820, partial [Pirellulales bacterium]|nr:hypothetical protein [Pirellulales bacterium]
MMKWLFNCSAALLLVGLGWAMPLQVQAQGTYYYWNVASPDTGTYDDGANWVDSEGTPMGLAPSAGDSAIIKNDGSLLVDVISPIGDDVNYPYQIWVGAGTTGPLDPSDGHVVQESGGVYFEKYLCVGTDASPGTSTWTMTGGTIDQKGTGGGMYVGDTSNGSMTVENSTITLTGKLQVGGSAEGTMTLNSGAIVLGATYLEVGKNANAVGTLTINNGATAAFGTSNSSVGFESGTGSLEMSGTASGTFTGKLCVGYNGGTGSIDLSGSATI